MENNEEQININKIIYTLWSEKRTIILISSIFALFSIFYSLSLPNVYQSNAILTIAEAQSSRTQSASPLSTLTSSFGMNIGTNNVNNAKVAVSIMNSWGFAEQLIIENDLEFLVGAAIGWDEQNDLIIFDDELVDQNKMNWLKEPTSWELFQNLKSLINIRYDETDQFIFLSADSFSPKESKRLVDIFLSAINNYMRDRQILMSDQNLAYLEEQLREIKNKDLKQVFYSLILEENKNKMLAKANPEYMFVIVSKPMVPEKKSKPVRSIIVVSLTFLGFFMSCLYVLFKNRRTL